VLYEQCVTTLQIFAASSALLPERFLGVAPSAVTIIMCPESDTDATLSRRSLMIVTAQHDFCRLFEKCFFDWVVSRTIAYQWRTEGK
jgi:hypothetical protein